MANPTGNADYVPPANRRLAMDSAWFVIARYCYWLIGTAAFVSSMLHAISQASAVVILAYLVLGAVTVARR